MDAQSLQSIELNERELLIAEKAAEMAVRKMTDNFYRDIGKNVFQKFFIILGAAFVAFALGKGWIKFD